MSGAKGKYGLNSDDGNSGVSAETGYKISFRVTAAAEFFNNAVVRDGLVDH
jgi:hypothetical protein